MGTSWAEDGGLGGSKATVSCIPGTGMEKMLYLEVAKDFE